VATTKISVTVDTETLERIKQFLPGNFNLSAILNEALRDQLHRHEMLALLDEMDRDDPMSEADDEAGETLWQQIQSSSIPGRSRRSPGKKNDYGTRSAKR
jgi:post-segregation antitoxin (ccd killing protein)